MFGDVKETALRQKCCLLISYTVFYTYHHNKNGLIKRLGRQQETDADSKKTYYIIEITKSYEDS